MKTTRDFLPSFKLLTGICILVLAGFGFYFYSAKQVQEFSDPSAKYKLYVSVRRYQALIPTMPGQASDAPGFAEIVDLNGNSFGKIPLPMIQMARDIVWTSEGAKLTAVGEWNFKDHSCYYWSEDQKEQIWVRR